MPDVTEIGFPYCKVGRDLVLCIQQRFDQEREVLVGTFYAVKRSFMFAVHCGPIFLIPLSRLGSTLVFSRDRRRAAGRWRGNCAGRRWLAFGWNHNLHFV